MSIFNRKNTSWSNQEAIHHDEQKSKGLTHFFSNQINKLISLTDGVVLSRFWKLLPAAIFAWSVWMNTYLWNTEKSSIIQNLEHQLDNQLSSIVYPLQWRIQSYEQMLFWMRGYFESSDGVNQREFRRYISSLNVEENFPEISWVSYSNEENSTQLSSYVHGNIWNRARVLYIEPENDRNSSLLWFDNFSDYNRKNAMSESLEKNEPVLSNPVILKQETPGMNTPWYIMFYPIENGVIEVSSPKQGWWAIAFRASELIEYAFDDKHASVNLQVYDGDCAHSDRLLYDSRKGRTMNATFDVTVSRTIDIANRKWTFVIHSTEENESQMSHKGYLNNILQSGAFITLLLTVFSYIFIRTRREALETICNLQWATNKILEMANHDALTWLPNRNYFIEWSEKAIAHANRNKHSLGVMFIDLDNFKTVNDSLGHDVGDELLIEVSRRMKDCIRAEDFIARKWWDEFILALTDLRTGEDAVNVAEKIIQTLWRPFHIKWKEIHIGSSIWIATYPEDATNIEDLQKFADIAMYGIKELGKNGFQFFSDGMQRSVEEQQTLATALHNAIKNQELSLNYQPIVDSKSGDIVSMEALLRWNHRELWEISPAKFIPIAESNGLIQEIWLWTLETLCKQMDEWKKEGINVPKIAYNLSLWQLRSKNIHTQFYEVLKKYNIRPREIEIEITESMLMDDIQNALMTIKSFSHMGFRIAIDDFGTGYSSLNYLRKMKISTLKIDKTFIDEITDDDSSFRVVAGIIALAHSIGIRIVAEWVETSEQFEYLKKLKCDFIQGYYCGKPWDVETTKKRIQERI